jgi:hypothetical protein
MSRRLLGEPASVVQCGTDINVAVDIVKTAVALAMCDWTIQTHVAVVFTNCHRGNRWVGVVKCRYSSGDGLLEETLALHLSEARLHEFSKGTSGECAVAQGV